MMLQTFQVNYEPCHENEVVCITGSVPSLGSWSPLALQPMTKDLSGSRWTCDIDVEAAKGSVIQYRYAVCNFMCSSTPQILQWETNLSPRQISVSEKTCSTGLETFGKYGECSVQRGPLVATREIHLMFEKANLTSLTSSLNSSHCRLGIKAIDITNSTCPVPVLVHNLSENDISPRPQCEHGEMLETSSDVLLFSTQGLPTNHEVKFIIQLIQEGGRLPTKKESPKRLKGDISILAEGVIMSNTLINSVGKAPLYFFDDASLSLGHVVVSYAVIEPMKNLEAHSLEVSYATHWKRRNQALNVGHRGMGRSLKDHSLITDPNADELVSIPENTIYSFKEAATHGADFVEFDVHVTKDGFPVLFHDFQFSLCMQEKLAPVGKGTTDFLCETTTAVEEDALAFGELQTALQTVPVHCGFDIEIKYPMVCEKSGPEYDGTPMDMNQSLDAILRVVLKYGGQRRIFFSAFNPDVCAMIRLKQCKYPVMMCNFGRTSLYESYNDPRSVCVENSILTSRAYQILGLCGHSEDYIKDPSLVKSCHSNGLTLMCWGEGTVDPSIRQKLSDVGVDGVIHDRMASFALGTKNTFESLEELKSGRT
ncbi:glycerophosphocholine phosphodiesterase GPCPD1 isoform X2 [Strongylocentrotus purpuratus]|uniref:Glycerophosphocholine phosphodiesterase GPCPD1 n=1 Tax=Strongylocentrotus purpuratus TaxID=7668 RepID=A0A7M7PQJ4_STRPU|nr:glycerophosphocholine phosphodiesterase GPCPD1 isoform X2 [Strongylocentrotus purpuratus]